MFEKILDSFRRRAIRKYAPACPTSLLPLKEIHTAAVILDVEEDGFNECKRELETFFKTYGIKTDFIFFDFRKLEKNELLLTSIQNTVLGKDINWYGMPRQGTVVMADKSYDLLIYLRGRLDFTGYFTVRRMDAKFKVGISEMPDNVLDLVVSGEDREGTLYTIKEYLQKIL
ncbi:MAG: hypothetical protein PUA47_08295 [Bacteroidales bacterium]|nr:hypothetical protein [Bacteroidales bacterium]